MSSDGETNTLGDRSRFMARRIAGNKEKLFAAPANERVGIAHDRLQKNVDLDEDAIAGGVPETVVDLFEAVEI